MIIGVFLNKFSFAASLFNMLSLETQRRFARKLQRNDDRSHQAFVVTQ